MGPYVVVSDYESLDRALRELRKRVRLTHHRPRHKRRYDYYEKPSELKRKRKRASQTRLLSWQYAELGVLEAL